jgi:hypothetical protein
MTWLVVLGVVAVFCCAGVAIPVVYLATLDGGRYSETKVRAIDACHVLDPQLQKQFSSDIIGTIGAISCRWVGNSTRWMTLNLVHVTRTLWQSAPDKARDLYKQELTGAGPPLALDSTNGLYHDTVYGVGDEGSVYVSVSTANQWCFSGSVRASNVVIQMIVCPQPSPTGLVSSSTLAQFQPVLQQALREVVSKLESR